MAGILTPLKISLWNLHLKFHCGHKDEEPHAQSTQSLNSVITHLHLGLLDAWRMKHPQSKQYTWVRVGNNRVSAARLDRLYISQNLISRFIYSNINPVGFTDHHFITIELVSTPGNRVKSQCFFKNKHLQDRTFCQSFELFWQQWEIRKFDFSTLKQWLEVGKAQIHIFYQQCTSFLHNQNQSSSSGA